MKYIKYGLLCFFMCFYLTACGAANTDTTEADADAGMNGVFRYADWGDSLEDIEKREPGTNLSERDDCLIYKDVELLSYNTDVIYQIDDGFYFGMYYITDKKYSPEEYDLYIKDFERIENSLILKYGEPDKKEETWENDALKGTPGFGLTAGHVKYESMWFTENATIGHTMYREEGLKTNIIHTIGYSKPRTIKELTSGL